MSFHPIVVSLPNHLCTLACGNTEVDQMAENSILDVKINEIHSYTQELIGGGEVRVTLIKLGPIICLIPIVMEHYGDCNNGRVTEEVNGMIYAPCFILDVEMELL
jgi:hypothetical protein